MGGTVILGEEGEDPGWKLDARVLLALLPQVGLMQARRDDILLGIRRAFVGVVLLLVIVTSVAAVIGDVREGKDQLALSLAIVVGDGVMSLALSRVFAPKLVTTSAERLASTFFARFAMRLACAMSAAVMGFALGIAVGPWWVVLCGLPFAAVGLLIAAPTRAAVRRDEDRLSLQGCEIPLVAALRSPSYRAGH